MIDSHKGFITIPYEKRLIFPQVHADKGIVRPLRYSFKHYAGPVFNEKKNFFKDSESLTPRERKHIHALKRSLIFSISLNIR